MHHHQLCPETDPNVGVEIDTMPTGDDPPSSPSLHAYVIKSSDLALDIGLTTLTRTPPGRKPP